LLQKALLNLGVYISDEYISAQLFYELLSKDATESPQAGDVAFFFFNYQGTSHAAHMGILTDEKGGMIHASRTDGKVAIVENYKNLYSPGCWENIVTCKTDSLYPSMVFIDPYPLF
jgi:cell wall-associated NlpC family hydrolase